MKSRPTTPLIADGHVTRKVLVVEDSEFVHQIYRVAFRRLGQFELLHATNGLEGLRTLDTHPDVDLILLDINMPIMDGLAFLGELRVVPGQRNTFVIVASTEREDGKIREALARGAQAFLKKPFTLEQLLELLQRVLPILPARSARWGT
jgi:two-component system chemotaxis response regulator CheY